MLLNRGLERVNDRLSTLATCSIFRMTIIDRESLRCKKSLSGGEIVARPLGRVLDQPAEPFVVEIVGHGEGRLIRKRP